jgi:hypothetical protein
MTARVFVGRDVELIRETQDGVELDGRIRLRPGFVVELIPIREGQGPARGTALVWSWRIRALGSRGPLYRGLCRWQPFNGNELPAHRPPVPATSAQR